MCLLFSLPSKSNWKMEYLKHPAMDYSKRLILKHSILKTIFFKLVTEKTHFWKTSNKKLFKGRHFDVCTYAYGMQATSLIFCSLTQPLGKRGKRAICIINKKKANFSCINSQNNWYVYQFATLLISFELWSLSGYFCRFKHSFTDLFSLI